MKILLVDDHPLFMDGLRTLLTVHGMEVIGTARNGLEAVEQARALQPDAILMDIQMPHLDGLAATRLIKAETPGVKIVVLTMSHDSENLFEAIKSGASGYLLKTEDTDKFFELLTGVMNGETSLSSSLAGRVLAEFIGEKAGNRSVAPSPAKEDALTERQIQVLTLVAKGLTYKEAGAKLYISERTIKYHMGEIVERLHLSNRRQAVAYARSMKMGNE